MERILIVDDEESIRTFIGAVLESEGLKVTLAEDGDEAARLLQQHNFHLMVTDLRMPGLDGMALLRKVRAEEPEMEVIVLTAHGTVENAVEAMKLGAFDYLTKPLSGPDEIALTVMRALERRRLREHRHRADVHAAQCPALVARDPAMAAVVEQVRKVAATDTTVLLLGESGTGKEVVARTVHQLSRRREGPMVAVNCAALSPSLLESEMFGHERGAFTGATTSHRGRFELADGGTLFLDEVGDLAPELQAKLLRVLEQRRFERVGGSREIEVDIRLVAATNHNLLEEMRAGRFREDLYHRLAVFPIRIVPLRDRPADLEPLADALLDRIARQLGRVTLTLSPAARARLAAYSWPGNVRELANVLERAAILADGPVIGAEHLSLEAGAVQEGGIPLPAVTLDELEREAIRQALVATSGHRKNAAARLGIGLRTLYDKLKQHALE
ncbi:MAG: sigma-54-dependent Fis family transcriptional regulator [Myxococcales bacterium]|nr:sigma-54-dependent Fis family transcriptional regulator [Myxococcales bacterium]